MRDKLREVCEADRGSIVFGEPLSKHSTISIGGKAEAWYVPLSLEGLRRTKTFLDRFGIKTVIMGCGSNVLIPDEGIDAVVVNLSSDAFKKIEREGNIVTVGAGADLGTLISDCCRYGLGGLEGLAGIPATVGGALATNASYRVAISEFLVKVLVLDAAGDIKWIEKKDLRFGYRFSSLAGRGIVVQAVFHLDEVPPDDLKTRLKDHFTERAERQPLDKRTLGCIFKNPERGGYTSGEMIDAAGMKGFRYGAAQVSEKHANFIVNTDGASSADVTGLMGEIKRKVREKFSVELEPEIEIWDPGS